jgi:hypothetical protein
MGVHCFDCFVINKLSFKNLAGSCVTPLAPHVSLCASMGLCMKFLNEKGNKRMQILPILPSAVFAIFHKV